MTIKQAERQFVLRTKDKIEVRAGTKGHTQIAGKPKKNLTAA